MILGQGIPWCTRKESAVDRAAISSTVSPGMTVKGHNGLEEAPKTLLKAAAKILRCGLNLDTGSGPWRFSPFCRDFLYQRGGLTVEICETPFFIERTGDLVTGARYRSLTIPRRFFRVRWCDSIDLCVIVSCRRLILLKRSRREKRSRCHSFHVKRMDAF